MDDATNLFEPNDPIGAIAVDVNDMAVPVPACDEFRSLLLAVGFERKRGIYLPPPGPFIRMEDVVPADIIDAMFDTGYYPEQKTA